MQTGNKHTNIACPSLALPAIHGSWAHHDRCLSVDGRNPAPPIQARNDSPGHTNKRWFQPWLQGAAKWILQIFHTAAGSPRPRKRKERPARSLLRSRGRPKNRTWSNPAETEVRHFLSDVFNLLKSRNGPRNRKTETMSRSPDARATSHVFVGDFWGPGSHNCG